MERMFFPVTRREAERSGVPHSSEANKSAIFPSQLRELRKEKGVSQDTLSKALGVSKSTVGLWETGDTLPDAKSLCELAKFFDVSADYLLGLSKARRHEYHDFAKLTRFQPSTINQLMLIAGSKFNWDHEETHPDLARSRVSFEYLINSIEFLQVLEDLRGYLDMSISCEPPDTDLYIVLDEQARKLSGNKLCVVSAGLMAQTFLLKAQQHIEGAFQAAKYKIDKAGGWKRYLGYK